MMLQMSDVREGGRFLGVGGFWVVGLSSTVLNKPWSGSPVWHAWGAEAR
jgi:hypothetical protein